MIHAILYLDPQQFKVNLKREPERKI